MIARRTVGAFDEATSTGIVNDNVRDGTNKGNWEVIEHVTPNIGATAVEWMADG